MREICENLRKVRNELSHRSVSEDKICIDSYQKHLKEQGFPLNKKGEVSFYRKDKEADRELKELYNSQINNSEDHKHYKYLIWYYGTPFDDIVNGLNEIASVIRTVLK